MLLIYMVQGYALPHSMSKRHDRHSKPLFHTSRSPNWFFHYAEHTHVDTFQTSPLPFHLSITTLQNFQGAPSSETGTVKGPTNYGDHRSFPAGDSP